MKTFIFLLNLIATCMQKWYDLQYLFQMNLLTYLFWNGQV
jgi:hypothetical protein